MNKKNQPKSKSKLPNVKSNSDKPKPKYPTNQTPKPPGSEK